MTNESVPVEQRDVNLGNLIWSRFNVDGAGDEVRRAAIHDIAQFRIACTPTAVDGDMVGLAVWCVSIADHLADQLTPRQIEMLYKAGDALRATQSIRAKALEDAAQCAEQKYKDHGSELGTTRARSYEHAGKSIAAAIRSLKGEQSS